MTSNKPWYADEEFWAISQPFMFYDKRLEKAPYEIDCVLSLLKRSAPANVLDLCSGVGRHSLELARRGFSVVGVDLNKSYLEQAKAKAKQDGLKIEFLEGDMREFVREDAFDFVINMWTSFSYFDDNEDNCQVLRNVYRSLKPGGALLIEMASKEILAMNFETHTWDERNGVIILEERRVVDAWQKLESKWTVINGADRKEVIMRNWLYSAGELLSMLKQSGFANVEFFGSLEGTPYDHQAKRMVAVACKA